MNIYTIQSSISTVSSSCAAPPTLLSSSTISILPWLVPISLRSPTLYILAPQNATGVTGYSAETTQLVAADFLISFTDLFGDFALVYRCWMLWGKNYYIVILPLLAAVGGFSEHPSLSKKLFSHS